MTPAEIKQNISPLEKGPLSETEEPSVFRSDWKPLKNGAKMCILYTIKDGRTVATPALCVHQNEKESIKEALGRIENL